MTHQWSKRIGPREGAACPELYKKLGLIIEDTDFNRRAKAYANAAKWWADSMVRHTGKGPVEIRPVYGMKP